MSQTTDSDLLTLLTSFLTVAIHTILFHRRIYSPALFLPARAYNSLVRQIRHPSLCQWIADAISTVEEQLASNSLLRVSLIILSPADSEDFAGKERPLERFVFDTSRFPGEGDAVRAVEGVERELLEEQFRCVVEKIAIGSMGLGKLPEGCSFTIALEVREGDEGGVNDFEPVGGSSKKGGKGAAKTSLRTIKIGEERHCIDVWVEESRAKKQLS